MGDEELRRLDVARSCRHLQRALGGGRVAIHAGAAVQKELYHLKKNINGINNNCLQQQQQQQQEKE